MPIMTLDAVPQGKVKPSYNELEKQNKRLLEELDTWKKAYAVAENESTRFQEAYEEIYQELQKYKP